MSSDIIKIEAIGTNWIIEVESQKNIIKITNAIHEIIEKFDQTFSRFRTDSITMSMNHNKGDYLFSDEYVGLFDLYQRLYKASDGKITPMIGQSLSDLGYDKNYSLKPKNIIAKTPDWNEVLEIIDNIAIIKKPCLLDFGAAGKGFLVELIAKYLMENDIFKFTIDASGDIKHYDINRENKIRIGLENPQSENEIIGVIELSNLSICASATNRRNWLNYTHIIDPNTNQSPKNTLATWAINKSADIADGIATALFVTSPKKLKNFFNFEYLIIKENMNYEKSDDFPGEIFLK